MASVVDICNKALGYLGDAQINDLAEQSPEARLCAAQYPLLRDEVLESHPWRFATTVQVLALLSGETDDQYTYVYQMPSDALRVLAISSGSVESQDFELRGQFLLTNLETAKCKYTQRITDPVRFPPLFVDAVARKLASALATAKSLDSGMVRQQESLYSAAIARARNADASQVRTDFSVMGSSILGSAHR